MGQLEEMNASLAAMKASLKAIERQNAATRVDELAAVVVKQNADLRAAMIQQHAELRQDVIKQNADNAVLMLKQTAALIAAVQEQTKAIEKLAAPLRESGKRKRVEGTSADAGNQQETSATDSQTSAAEKLLSSSLKGKGPADAGEGTSTARRKKKMKTPAPAPAKEVVSVNATSPHEGTCTWTIPNFSKLKVSEWGQKYSDTFSIGGHKWKLEVFPRGYDFAKDKSVSLFLHLDNTNKLSEDGKVTAGYSFSLICQHDSEKSRKKDDDSKNIEFNAKTNNWGWHNFISLTDFHDAAKGFLVNDTVIFEAKIEVKIPAKTKRRRTRSITSRT